MNGFAAQRFLGQRLRSKKLRCRPTQSFKETSDGNGTRNASLAPWSADTNHHSSDAFLALKFRPSPRQSIGQLHDDKSVCGLGIVFEGLSQSSLGRQEKNWPGVQACAHV